MRPTDRKRFREETEQARQAREEKEKEAEAWIEKWRERLAPHLEWAKTEILQVLGSGQLKRSSRRKAVSEYTLIKINSAGLNVSSKERSEKLRDLTPWEFHRLMQLAFEDLKEEHKL